MPALCKFNYCDRCELIQPPRAHHCPICSCCVLRSDHHCFWMGNCIGLYNHKYFILYLIYTTLTCLYIPLIFTKFLKLTSIELLDMILDEPSVVVVIFTCFAIALCLAILLIINLRLLSINQTTIELS
jgi:hypothetical protein